MHTVLEGAFAVVRQWLIANWHIAHIVFFLFAYSFCPIVTYQESSSLGNVGCTTSESVRYFKKMYHKVRLRVVCEFHLCGWLHANAREHCRETAHHA